jgi:hypothetical protein
MAALVAPGICRYTIEGTYAGNPVANVLDMHVDIVGSVTDRNTALADQAAIIISAWVDEILENLPSVYTADIIRWVDLNAADGAVGSATLGTGTDFPSSGTSVGDPMPGNVAVRVNKQISASRGQRQGRMYLPGITESQTSAGAPNAPSAAYIAALNTDLAAFLAAINQNAGTVPPNYDSWLSVVHTENTASPGDPPVIVFDGFSHVTSLVCDGTLATQRRRLRR